MMHPVPDPDLFRAGMRRVASSVTIIAAELAGERRGLTATSVCSVSLEPPSLLACVNRKSGAHELIRRSRRFSVNVLAAGQDGLARRFGSGYPGNRFADGEWTRMETGAPILVGGVASFDCVLFHSVELATHDIFIGLVVATRSDGPGTPLLYIDRTYAGLH